MGEVLVGTAAGLHYLGSHRVELPSHSVTAMAPTGADGWMALTAANELWSAEGAAAPWVRVAALSGHRATCFAPVDGSVLAGTTGAHLLRVSGGEVEPVPAFEAVDGRERWYTPWGAPPDTRSLATAAGGALLVNVHVGGIPRSTDGGATWQPTIDIDSDVHQVVASSPRRGSPEVVVAATALGLAYSDDGGASWEFVTDGLHATYSRAVAVAADSVLCSVSNGPGGGQSAVYRADLPLTPASRLERCVDGLPEWFGDNVDTGCLAADAELAAIGSRRGDVYVSTDGGRTWAQRGSGLPAVNWVAVTA